MVCYNNYTNEVMETARVSNTSTVYLIQQIRHGSMGIPTIVRDVFN